MSKTATKKKKVTVVAKTKAVPKVKTKAKAKVSSKAKADTKTKATSKVKATPKAKAVTKTKTTSKIKATAKVKATSKVKTTSKVKATPKVKANLKKKAVSKVKAMPKTKAAPKVKVASAKKTKTISKLAPTIDEIPTPKPRPSKPISKKKAAFIKQVSNVLSDMKNKILHEVSEKIRIESEDSNSLVGDIYDIASIERERELNLILGDRDRAKLGEIEDAFDRIKTNTYEECHECGEPIAFKRLLAMPFTRVCIECKSRHERQQKATGRYNENLSGTGVSDSDDEF